mgnify:CR=1 FL=1|jgi:mono/diheme cytochrome c family protein
MKTFFKTLKYLGFLFLAVFIGAFVYLKFVLPNAEPAPEITIQLTDERIKRGEYLANHVTVCMDCHSTRDWSYFAGPVSAGKLGGGGELFGREMGFPGNYYSKNITPFAIKDWTDGEIFRAITTGVSRDGSALFPVMPYTSYGQMDKEDIYSIIAYLRTLEPLESIVPSAERDFPVNLLINTMPTKSVSLSIPDTNDMVKYGQYLVVSASCVECHSQMDKGAKIPGTEFGGGMEFKFPGSMVRSANITPDIETGIGTWTEEMFLGRFKTFSDSTYRPQKIENGTMNTPMPWQMYAGMKESDLKAIFSYLKTLKPMSHKVEKFTKL